MRIAVGKRMRKDQGPMRSRIREQKIPRSPERSVPQRVKHRII